MEQQQPQQETQQEQNTQQKEQPQKKEHLEILQEQGGHKLVQMKKLAQNWRELTKIQILRKQQNCQEKDPNLTKKSKEKLEQYKEYTLQEVKQIFKSDEQQARENTSFDICINAMRYKAGQRHHLFLDSIENYIQNMWYIKKYSKYQKHFSRQVANIVQYQFFNKGDTVLSINDEADSFYIVMKGKVAVIATDELKKEEKNQQLIDIFPKYYEYKKNGITKQILLDNIGEFQLFEQCKNFKWKDIKDLQYFLEKNMVFIKQLGFGQSFGELGILNKAKRSASILALEDIHLMKISKEDYEKIITQIEQYRINKRIEFLKKVFSYEFTKQQFMHIFTDFNHKEPFNLHSNLFKEGDPITHIYLIKKGEIQIHKHQNIQQQQQDINNNHPYLNYLKGDQNLPDKHHLPHNHTYDIPICSKGMYEFVGLDDYFNHQKSRTYTAVSVKSYTKCYVISLQMFSRLLNCIPMLREILQQRQQEGNFSKNAQQKITNTLQHNWEEEALIQKEKKLQYQIFKKTLESKHHNPELKAKEDLIKQKFPQYNNNNNNNNNNINKRQNIKKLQQQKQDPNEFQPVKQYLSLSPNHIEQYTKNKSSQKSKFIIGNPKNIQLISKKYLQQQDHLNRRSQHKSMDKKLDTIVDLQQIKDDHKKIQQIKIQQEYFHPYNFIPQKEQLINQNKIIQEQINYKKFIHEKHLQQDEKLHKNHQNNQNIKNNIKNTNKQQQELDFELKFQKIKNIKEKVENHHNKNQENDPSYIHNIFNSHHNNPSIKNLFNRATKRKQSQQPQQNINQNQQQQQNQQQFLQPIQSPQSFKGFKTPRASQNSHRHHSQKFEIYFSPQMQPKDFNRTAQGSMAFIGDYQQQQNSNSSTSSIFGFPQQQQQQQQQQLHGSNSHKNFMIHKTNLVPNSNNNINNDQNSIDVNNNISQKKSKFVQKQLMKNI